MKGICPGLLWSIKEKNVCQLDLAGLWQKSVTDGKVAIGMEFKAGDA